MAQTETDLDNQKMVEEFVNSSGRGFKLIPFHFKYALLDGWCRDASGDLVGMYESRSRYTLTNNQFVNEYGMRSLLGLQKWTAMRHAAQITGMPVYFAYGMRDAIYFRQVIFSGGKDCVPFSVVRVPSARSPDELCAEIPMRPEDRIDA